MAGRDENGPWTIRRDGSVERFDAGRVLPRWINLGDETILVESVEALLVHLRREYVLERGDAEDGETGELRIIATRTPGERGAPGPDRVEIWIDVDTDVVARMTLEWEQPEPPRHATSHQLPAQSRTLTVAPPGNTVITP